MWFVIEVGARTNTKCDVAYLERDRERERDRDLEREGLRLRDGLRLLLPCDGDRELDRDRAERFDAPLRRERFEATLPASDALPEKLLPSESDIFSYYTNQESTIPIHLNLTKYY